MRTYLVAALVIAIVACLTCGGSAAGYGYGGRGVAAPYVPPTYGYRYYRQPYSLGGYSGFQRYGTGFNRGGYFSAGGFNIIWLLLIGLVLLAILSDK